jgi:hypothetical protein
MKIETALDFQDVSIALKRDIQSAGYNPDLIKMLKNIETMVTDLSKLEVTARRIQKFSYTVDLVNKINASIDRLEKLILMAQLMR